MQTFLKVLNIIIPFAMLLTMIAGIVITGKRLTKSHIRTQNDNFDNFKQTIFTEIATLKAGAVSSECLSNFKDTIVAEIGTLKLSGATRIELESLRREDKESIIRLHNRIDSTNSDVSRLAKEINGNLLRINTSLVELKASIKIQK